MKNSRIVWIIILIAAMLVSCGKKEEKASSVTTFTGKAGNAGLTDGTGDAARFNNPAGITSDGTNLYVADTDNNIIRKIIIDTGEETIFMFRIPEIIPFGSYL